MKSEVSVVKCNSYDSAEVFRAVKKGVDLVGGISAFIKPGSRVLVKPNLLMAKEPVFAVDTHPEVVRAVIKVLKEINCALFVGDGPSVWGGQAENVNEVYERSGVKKVCDEESVALVKFDKRRMREKFPLTAWLDNCDYLVNIPKFKTHTFTLLTGAIKNLFGLVSGTYKTELHKNYFNIDDFSKILVDVYQETRPALTIVDGVVAMEGEGPGTGGRLRNLGLILAGADCAALDSVLTVIMGIEPYDVLTTKEAALRGLGNADINSITILGERLADILGEPFLLPSSGFKKKKVPLPILNLAKKLIKYYPYIEVKNCLKCAACVQACPSRAIAIKRETVVFDYRKCIACFCCQEACPNSAVKIKKSIAAKMMGL